MRRNPRGELCVDCRSINTNYCLEEDEEYRCDPCRRKHIQQEADLLWNSVFNALGYGTWPRAVVVAMDGSGTKTIYVHLKPLPQGAETEYEKWTNADLSMNFTEETNVHAIARSFKVLHEGPTPVRVYDAKCTCCNDDLEEVTI